MVDLYKSAHWREFRAEVIRLDEGVCARCHRGKSEGVILQVHHLRYLPGHKPWEYPHDLCETLCQGCHAQEHGLIRPNSGWEVVGYDDLEEPSANCDLCNTEIRYVFLVQHEKWFAMEVGTDCCDRLTSTETASDYQRMIERRKRFVSSPRWKSSKSGGASIRQDGRAVAILPIKNDFKLKIDGVSGNLRFGSALDAKIKVFDLFEDGSLDRYFSSQ